MFLGLSAGGVLKPEMVAKMAAGPLILALANPTPEIAPDLVKAVRDDASSAPAVRTIRTRSNNVLCFPFIFRGALDVGATTITEEMKMAAVKAIAELAHGRAVRSRRLGLWRKVIRLRPGIPDSQALRPAPDRQDRAGGGQGGMDSGVATRPIRDWTPTCRAERIRLPPGLIMKPVFSARKAGPSGSSLPKARTSACCAPCRWVPTRHRAADPDRPPAEINRRAHRGGRPAHPRRRDYEIWCSPTAAVLRRASTDLLARTYHRLTERKGVSPDYAARIRRRAT